MGTMIHILEVWVKEKLLQHLLSKGSAFIGRRNIDRIVVAHLGIERWCENRGVLERYRFESGDRSSPESKDQMMKET